MNQSGNILDKLQRYRAAAERSYYKALRELQTSRKQTGKAEANAFETYIKKVIFAPVPGHDERKLYHAAVNHFMAGKAELQNEPNQPAVAAPGSVRFPARA